MKISIVTINYNNLKGLQVTTTSVLGQTYPNKEMIVIDGGSTDGSAEFIANNKDSFVYSVSEKDNGIYNAMNKGVLHASGDYVIFMNSGDCFFDDKVLEEVFGESNYSSDIIYGSTLCRTAPGMAFLRKPHTLEVMKNNHISALCHQSTFIRTALMKEVGYDESYKLLGDYVFFYKCYEQGRSFQEVNKIISVYDTFGASSNPHNRWQSYNEQCRLHGMQPRKYKYNLMLFKNFIKNGVKAILPLSIKRKLGGLPNGNMPISPISTFKQLS